MGRRIKNIFSLVCTFILCIGLSTTAGATNREVYETRRASDQLAYYTAYAVTSSNGKVIIEFEVDGTGRMDLIGSSYIVIQEKSGSNWVGVSTHFGSISNGMLDDNTFAHVGSITYSGIAGKEYRALVTVYGENSKGNDSRTVTTNAVTAR